MSGSTGKRVMIFGATGTVGAGTVLECLDHPGVAEVVCVLRRPSGRTHPKLREVIHADFGDMSALTPELQNVDGCLWAIGVPQSGRTEAAYREITVDYAVAAADALYTQSPECCFVFISGAGADETGKSRTMWARVKGEAENAVLERGFSRALVFRPGVIAAKRGIRHSVRSYGWFSVLAPVIRPFGWATSTVEIGQAFLAAVLGRSLDPSETCRLESAAINAFAKRV